MPTRTTGLPDLDERNRTFPVVFAALIAGAAVPVSIGFAWQKELFSGTPSSFCWLLAVVALITLMTTLVTHRFIEKLPGAATLLAVAAFVAFICYCGPATAFAAILLALCGVAITPKACVVAGNGQFLGLLAGMAILAGLVGWLLPFPVHGIRIYLAFATFLCVWRRDVIRYRVGQMWKNWERLEQESPVWLAYAVAAAFIAGLGLWLPSMNFDDNAAHLIMPYQLLADGYYHLDVSTQAWAVAPWANNVLNGIAALFAGQEARAALNMLWLLVGLNGAWRLATALSTDSRTALAATIAYASLPLTGYFTTTMQVDGASTAVLTQFAALLVTSGRTLPPAALVGALLGLLASLKAPNAIFVFPAIVWLGWLIVRQRRFGWLFQVSAIAILLSASSYFYAVLVTGNPLFPLFNATFKSGYFPLVDLVDGRWNMGLSWRSLWDMTYSTGLYGEHYPGAFGIATLALLPALFIEAVRRPASRGVAIWFLISGVLMFAQIQYIRYLYPAIAILSVVGVVGLARLMPLAPFAALFAGLVAANFLLLPSTSWLLRDDPWRNLVLHGPSAREMIEAEKIPERIVLRRILEGSSRACVLIANQDAPFGAIAGGRAVVVRDPYDSRMAKAYAWADSDPTGARWQQVISSSGVSHIITGSEVSAPLQMALATGGFELVDKQGSAMVWALSDPAQRTCGAGLETVRDEAHRHFHPGDTH